MRFLSRIRSMAANLLRKEKVERRLDDELRTYVEMVTDERIAAGMPAAEARRHPSTPCGACE